MSKLVILITSRIEEGHQIGEAWQQAGAPGVTFIESYGLRRMQEASKKTELLPGMMSMFEILRQQDETSLIVLSVVDNDAIVDKLLDEAKAVFGDLLSPHTGLVFVIDVERAIGVRDHGKG
jgi:nitrogen regulatory protein PII